MTSDLRYSRAWTDAVRFPAFFEGPCPTPMFTPLTVVYLTVEKEAVLQHKKAVLTDGGDVIQGIVFRSLLHEAPLEVLGHVPPRPRLSLQEVVKVSNGVYVRGCHGRISNNLVNRSTLLAAE
jgi:hypothetical protein